jgi:hypothetical protein
MVRTVPHLLHSIATKPFRDTICTPAEQAYGEGACGLWVMLFIYSKVPELGDTVFIVFRKAVSSAQGGVGGASRGQGHQLPCGRGSDLSLWGSPGVLSRLGRGWSSSTTTTTSPCCCFAGTRTPRPPPLDCECLGILPGQGRPMTSQACQAVSLLMFSLTSTVDPW